MKMLKTYSKVSLVLMSLSLVLVNRVQGQMPRADYFKDEIMRFTTYECWKEQPVDPKPKGMTRIAVVGDATTLGVGGERSMLKFDYDYHFQLDGSKAGYGGYPFYLYSLLKEHN